MKQNNSRQPKRSTPENDTNKKRSSKKVKQAHYSSPQADEKKFASSRQPAQHETRFNPAADFKQLSREDILKQATLFGFPLTLQTGSARSASTIEKNLQPIINFIMVTYNRYQSYNFRYSRTRDELEIVENVNSEIPTTYQTLTIPRCKTLFSPNNILLLIQKIKDRGTGFNDRAKAISTAILIIVTTLRLKDGNNPIPQSVFQIEGDSVADTKLVVTAQSDTLFDYLVFNCQTPQDIRCVFQLLSPDTLDNYPALVQWVSNPSNFFNLLGKITDIDLRVEILTQLADLLRHENQKFAEYFVGSNPDIIIRRLVKVCTIKEEYPIFLGMSNCPKFEKSRLMKTIEKNTTHVFAQGFKQRQDKYYSQLSSPIRRRMQRRRHRVQPNSLFNTLEPGHTTPTDSPQNSSQASTLLTGFNYIRYPINPSVFTVRSCLTTNESSSSNSDDSSHSSDTSTNPLIPDWRAFD